MHSAENSIAGLYACVNDVVAGPGLPIPDYIGNAVRAWDHFDNDDDWVLLIIAFSCSIAPISSSVHVCISGHPVNCLRAKR